MRSDGALRFRPGLPTLFTGHVIARWKGVLFLGYYLAYMLYLSLRGFSPICCRRST